MRPERRSRDTHRPEVPGGTPIARNPRHRQSRPSALLVGRPPGGVVRVGPLVLLLVLVGPLAGPAGRRPLVLVRVVRVERPRLLPAAVLLVRHDGSSLGCRRLADEGGGANRVPGRGGGKRQRPPGAR